MNLTEREFRRRHMRILASRRHRRIARHLLEIRRQPIEPGLERMLRERALGGHTCHRIVLPGPAAEAIAVRLDGGS